MTIDGADPAFGQNISVTTADELASAFASALAQASRLATSQVTSALHVSGMRIDMRCEVMKVSLAPDIRGGAPRPTLRPVASRRPLLFTPAVDLCDLSVAMTADPVGNVRIDSIDLKPVPTRPGPFTFLARTWRRLLSTITHWQQGWADRREQP